ncbi:MAG: nucleotide sugar dehydrogenase [Bacteroidales bacterium]|nr:nucleotide sugar dehydrogenase [Bacteroidales bacterium]
MYNDIVAKRKKISVVGLGYVGLPIALAFAKKVPVIGFDINAKRVDLMNRKIDPSNELESGDFDNADIIFTSNPEDLKQAHFHIVAVPTPINSYKQPDLTPLLSATRTVGKVLKKGDYVVYESTVYPGATEEDCLPILEELSGLKNVQDFKLGYSPERINPGDRQHTIDKIVKVVSGCDAASLDNIAKIYELIITAGVHRASSIKVAEAAKIIENTQRDVNIALMNELSVIFNKMNINTFEVLEAAGTKWNFLRFFPGLVGGHCIGVDPYYLTYKANKLGYNAHIINSGRAMNDSMASYIAKELVKKIIKTGKNILHSKVLVMGVTFKENVTDIRNTKVIDLINELRSFGATVDVTDPHASSEELHEEYGVSLTPQLGNDYDAIVLAVAHNEYTNLDEDYFNALTTKEAIMVDIKGIYRNKIKKLNYFSL